MSITLDDALLMVGRLDDAPGFDTSRERFRRFIGTHINDVRVARAFIEQCQRSIDEQHHRALKDLVTILGRFLGLETAFGTYTPVSGALQYDGHWRYPQRLNIVLEVRTDRTQGADVSTLTRAVAAMSASSLLRGSSTPPIGLSVVTTHYPRRIVLEDAIASRKGEVPIKLASVSSLLRLAEMVDARHITHSEVLRILSSDLAIDFIVDLLERSSASDVANHSLPVEQEEKPAFWVAVVGGDVAATPEQILERVIGKRRLFGLRRTGARPTVGRPGERVCFYLAGAGVVGHARIESVVENGAGLREADRFSHVLHLGEPELHLRTPVRPGDELQRRLDSDAAATPLVRVSEEEFGRLTWLRRPKAQADTRDAALIAADSRSRD